MPSSHSQFVAFFAIYLSLFILYRHTPTLPNPRVMSWFLALGLCAGAGAVALSRIYLNYHTPKQVWAGIAAGVFCAFSWFFVTWFLRTSGWIDWVLDLQLVRYMRIRDLVINEDLHEAGWQRWESQRSLRRRDRTNRSSSKSE